MKSVKRCNNEQPLAKKKMKQMTLMESLKLWPKVLVTPLRVPLEVIQSNPEQEVKISQPLKTKTVAETAKKIDSVNLPEKVAKVMVTDSLKKMYKDLPPPTLISLPGGLDNEHYGDALSIAEFITNYRNALQVPLTVQISTNTLLSSITRGIDGYGYINDILSYLVKAVVQDSKIELELGVQLTDVPITCYSLSEIVRLFLNGIEKQQIKSNLSSLLKSKEIHQLTPSVVFQVLSVVCETALDSQVVQRHVAKFENQKKKLYIRKAEIRNLQVELTLKLNNLREMDEPVNETETSMESCLSPSSFYGSAFVEASNRVSDEGLSRGLQRKIIAEKTRSEKAKVELKRQERIKVEKEIAKMETTIKQFQTDNEIVPAEVRKMKRKTPLGIDRNDTRYWWFSHSVPNLILEKNWISNNPEVEQPPLSEWYSYRSPDDLKKLMEALCEFDRKELDLKLALKVKSSDFVDSFKIKDEDDLESSNWDGNSLEALKEDMGASVEIITSKSLGWMKSLDSWLDKLAKAKNVSRLRDLLIELFDCLYPSSLDKEEKKDIDLDKWVGAVRECQTLSQLHVLFTILSIHVNWDKAILKKCKICHRAKTNFVVVCNRCKQNFHLDCLEPSLLKPPDKNWHCPSCTDSSDEEEDKVEQRNCCVCGCTGRSKLIGCNKCRAAYHAICHNPPLTEEIRDDWTCGICKGKGPNSRKKKDRQSQGLRRSSRHH